MDLKQNESRAVNDLLSSNADANRTALDGSAISALVGVSGVGVTMIGGVVMQDQKRAEELKRGKAKIAMDLKLRMIERQKRGVFQLPSIQQKQNSGNLTSLRTSASQSNKSPIFESARDLLAAEHSLDLDRQRESDNHASSMELEAFKTSRTKDEQAKQARKADEALHKLPPIGRIQSIGGNSGIPGRQGRKLEKPNERKIAIMKNESEVDWRKVNAKKVLSTVMKTKNKK